MHTWIRELSEALTREETHARETHARLRSLPLAEQVEAGVCWADVRITDAQPAGRKWTAMARGSDLHDGIGPGDRIRLGKAGPTGRVGIVDVHGAELLLDDEPDERPTPIFLLFDDGSFRRYRKALADADELGGPVVEALLDPASDTPTEPEPLEWPDLDPSQAAAAEASRTRTVSLIHGPPGTGKTHVIATLLVRAVQEGDRPWALADSNAAVDHLARTASARGLAVLRLGVPARIDPALADLTLDGWMARSPFSTALQRLEHELARARSRKAGGRELGPLYDERRSLRDQARAWAFDSAQVFASTHGTLAARLQRGHGPPPARLAIVDEATQAVEPAIWACAPYVQRLVLVGDPEQLGPVVTSGDPVLQVSLLERLLPLVPAPMLTVQRRMHAGIQALVEEVYGDRYQPHPDVAARGLPGFPPVELVDTAGSGEQEAVDPVSLSRFNEGEVRLVGIALQRLLDAGVRPSDIAIATPYSAQVARLAALPEAAGVRVGSINALQGQEADVVLLSFVRSNDDGVVGFLSDQRRLTVGLTRARKHLWMVGDGATLGAHPLFADLFARCDLEGALTSVWAPPWSP